MPCDLPIIPSPNIVNRRIFLRSKSAHSFTHQDQGYCSNQNEFMDYRSFKNLVFWRKGKNSVLPAKKGKFNCR